MKAKPTEDLAVKKSLSFPPELWAFVLAYAGDTGTPSKVIQKAVKLLQDQYEQSQKSGIDQVKKATGKK